MSKLNVYLFSSIKALFTESAAAGPSQGFLAAAPINVAEPEEVSEGRIRVYSIYNLSIQQTCNIFNKKDIWLRLEIYK